MKVGWQECPDDRSCVAYWGGSSFNEMRFSQAAPAYPSYVSGSYPQIGYDGGEAVFLVFDSQRGLFVVASTPHKKLQKWTWEAPEQYWSLQAIAEVRVEVAGKRITHGGVKGHIAGAATLGYSYYATTKGFEQSWISVQFTNGVAITFLTESGHANTILGEISPFRAALAQVRVPTQSPGSATPPETPSIVNEIRALTQLRDDGLLTDEEFVARKQRVLES